MVGKLVDVEWVVVRFSVGFVGTVVQVKGQVQKVRTKLVSQCSYFQSEIVKHSGEFCGEIPKCLRRFYSRA